MSSAVATTTGAELQDPLLPSSSLKSEKPAPIVANGEKEAPAAKQSCLQQFCGFELRFWICTISCVLCYGVVQAYNYNSATVLLERNYFTPAQDITDCCCWQNGSCYESWPDPQDENSTISWTQYSDCRTGCNFDPSQQPVLNVTTEQMNHIDCNANASLWYGLNQDGWGYDLPALAPNASGTYLKLYCDMSNAADIVAADIAAIPYFVGVVLSPFLGILLDRIGGTALIMTITPAGFAAAHIVLGLFRDVPALVPLLLQGTSYSFFSAALWAPIAHVMPDHMQGVGCVSFWDAFMFSALVILQVLPEAFLLFPLVYCVCCCFRYGIITAALNFGTAVFPLVVAEIVTLSNNRYLPNTEYLFIGLSTGAFILGVWLCGVDWSRGKELSRSHWNDHGAGETANEDATTGDEEVGIGQGLSDQRSKPKPIVKAGLCMRWPVLIFICLMMVGNFYISELTALQDKLRNEFSDMSSEEFVFECVWHCCVCWSACFVRYQY